MHRILVCALAALPLSAAAQGLMQVYQDAKAYDAQFAAARSALQAGLEKLPQGRSLTRPNVNLSANTTNARIDFEPHNASIAPGFVRDARSYGYTLSLSQPIYRRQNLIQVDQAGYQVRQAEAVFGQAGQDLILRVSQAYFDVLAAEDTLGLVRAQKTAISEQLAQAKRNFEVGTATITDTHEAQARFDLAAAQEIAARNDLDAKKRALQQLTGKEYDTLKPLRSDVKLSGPEPSRMDDWVGLAEKQSYPVQVQEAATEISQLEVKRNAAAHQPTVDLVASYGWVSQTGSQISAVGANVTTGSVGVQFAVPLYAGGALTSREREAAANFDK